MMVLTVDKAMAAVIQEATEAWLAKVAAIVVATVVAMVKVLQGITEVVIMEVVIMEVVIMEEVIMEVVIQASIMELGNCTNPSKLVLKRPNELLDPS